MKGCRPLDRSEVAAIEARVAEWPAGSRNLALFRMGYMTGLRITELLFLRVCDVSLNGNLLEEVIVRRKTRKTKGEGLRVYVPSAARTALDRWFRERVESLGPLMRYEPVFCRLNNPTKAIGRKEAWRVLTTAARRSGIGPGVGTHCMRKTFAARFYTHVRTRRISGVDLDPIAETKEALGHVNVESTIAYLQIGRQHTRALCKEVWDNESETALHAANPGGTARGESAHS